jgi:hypothetical protein
MERGFYGILAELSFAELPIAQLPMQQQQQQQQQQWQRQQQNKRQKNTHRYVKWNAGEVYTQVRSGIAIKNEEELQSLSERGKLTEAHFYIFKHNDKYTTRGVAALPAYEAVYYLQERQTYVLVQKGHMRKIYAKCNRTDTRQMYAFVAPNLPYWVDRYIAIIK